MAFHIQHPERRNLLLEGILQGSQQGAQEASQMRMMKQKQQLEQNQANQSLSMLSQYLGGNQQSTQSMGQNPNQGQPQGLSQEELEAKGQATFENPLQFAALVSLLPSKEVRQRAWEGYKEMLDSQKVTPSEVSTAVLNYMGIKTEDLDKIAQGNPEKFKEIQAALEYTEKNAKGNPYRAIAEYSRKKENRSIEENIEQPVSKEKPSPIEKPLTPSEIRLEEEVNKARALEEVKLESAEKKEASTYVKDLTKKAIQASTLNQSLSDLNKVADIMDKKGQGALGTTTRASLAKKYPSFENFFLTNEQIQERILSKPLAELGKEIFSKLSEKEFFEIIRPMMITESDGPKVIREKTKALSKLTENMLIAPSLADLLIKNNNGQIPADIDRQILKQMIKASQKNLKIKV